MRVGVNTLFLIPGKVGGSETYLRETLHAIASGHEDVQFVLFTNRENDNLLRGLLGSAPRVEYCPLAFRATNRASRVLREQLQLPLAVRRSNVDLLWSPGYTSPVFCSCPQVVTIHDMQYKQYPEDFTLSARLALDILVRAGARRCRAIIAVSQFAKNEILNYTPARPQNVHIVHEGVDAMFSRSLTEDMIRDRARSLLHSDLPFLLCVGNTYPHKNVHMLAKTFGTMLKEIPHLLVIVGAPDSGEYLLTRAVNQLGRRDRVVRLGYRSQEDLMALYQAADLLVLPSLYEGFGLPVLEAMMSELPVVATRHGAIPEVGGDCVRYFDETGDGDLARSIREMLDMGDQERDVWVERAKARAQQFTWKRTAEQTVGVFREVLG